MIKKHEKLRAESPIPTEPVKPLKRVPPVYKVEKTGPDFPQESSPDRYMVKNREFDGKAIDPGIFIICPDWFIVLLFQTGTEFKLLSCPEVMVLYENLRVKDFVLIHTDVKIIF